MMEIYKATKEATGKTTPEGNNGNTNTNNNTSPLGSDYTRIFAGAAGMQVRGNNKKKIVDYLDTFGEDQLSDSGYQQIVRTLFPDER